VTTAETIADILTRRRNPTPEEVEAFKADPDAPETLCHVAEALLTPYCAVNPKFVAALPKAERTLRGLAEVCERLRAAHAPTEALAVATGATEP